MSMASLNRKVCALTRVVLNNPKLRVKDIMEWSTGEVKPQGENEIVIVLGPPLTGISVCIEKKYDKRLESESSAKSAVKKESR